MNDQSDEDTPAAYEAGAPKQSALYRILKGDWALVILTSVAVGMFTASVQTLPPERLQEALWDTLRLTTITLALFFAILAFAVYKQHRRVKRPWLLLAIVGANLVTAVGLLWALLPTAITAFLSTVMRAPTFVHVLFLCLLGAALFYFRLALRVVYGLTEALFGLKLGLERFAADTHIGLDGETAAFAFGLIPAGIYLMVRGLDNMHQGLKLKADPLACWLRDKFVAVFAPAARTSMRPKPAGSRA